MTRSAMPEQGGGVNTAKTWRLRNEKEAYRSFQHRMG